MSHFEVIWTKANESMQELAICTSTLDLYAKIRNFEFFVVGQSGPEIKMTDPSRKKILRVKIDLSPKNFLLQESEVPRSINRSKRL